MNQHSKFGAYITRRRTDLGITLRNLAYRLDITPAYLSNIEKGRRKPPEKTLLEDIASELMLEGDSKDRLFDLAGEERNEVASDVLEYIVENRVVRDALRLARNGATDEDWRQFIKKLNRKEK